MTDSDTAAPILRKALEASGLSGVKFAERVLNTEQRVFRRWISTAKTSRVPGLAVTVCKAIVARPALAQELEAANKADE